MTKQLCVGYIKCIQPSSMVPNYAMDIIKKIGAAFGVVVQSKVTSSGVAGGILVKVTGIKGQDVGGNLTVAVIEGLDKIISGKDDLYVKINDKKVWPKDEKFQEIKSQTKVTSITSSPTSLDNDVTIKLFDQDRFTQDDVVANLTISPSIIPNVYTYVLAQESENSIYEIQFTVTDD